MALIVYVMIVMVGVLLIYPVIKELVLLLKEPVKDYDELTVRTKPQSLDEAREELWKEYSKL